MKRYATPRRIGILLIAAAAACPGGFAEEPATKPASTQPAATQPAATAPAEAPKPKRVEYAPHIVIDWTVPQVEVEAEVVFREGYLELLACVKGTKEHESILATPARPLRLFEAMGLIGLEPGRPMSFDPHGREYIAATGQPLALEIRYEDDGKSRSVAPHDWMLTAETLKPVEPLPWIFCGSTTTDGSFAADRDGTVATVVDFETSLIGLATRHTSDDAALWLVANTKAIPEKGTRCTLVIRAAADRSPLVLTLTPEGYFLWKDDILTALQLDDLIKNRIADHPEQAVELSPMEGTSNLFAKVAARAIIGSGIKPANMKLHLHPEEEAGASEASEATTKPATQPAVRKVRPIKPPKPGNKPTTQPVNDEKR